MEESNSDAPMEGYLHKRSHAGVIKSLKKKWYVLKDGELRCYQNEDVCTKNAEMYQDALPVNHIQTVRNANENHGVEVVTQQKKFILVASSEEDQKKWIKAIYEALKDNRPRAVSCPTDKTSPTRKISASKFGLPRKFFNRKSLDETQSETQSQFYVDPLTANVPSHSRAEVGVQADFQIPQPETPAEVSKECQPDVVDILDARGATATETKTENADNNRHSVNEGSHLLDESEQGDISCVECKPKETTDNSIVLNSQVESQDTPRPQPCLDEQAGLVKALTKQHNVSYENGDITQQEKTKAGKESEPSFDPKAPSDSSDASGHDQVDTLVQTMETFPLNEPVPEKETLDKDDEKVAGAKIENSISELEALLQSISEGRLSDYDLEDFSSVDESISIGSDDESETTQQEGQSAFEQLQELLKG